MMLSRLVLQTSLPPQVDRGQCDQPANQQLGMGITRPLVTDINCTPREGECEHDEEASKWGCRQ